MVRATRKDGVEAKSGGDVDSLSLRQASRENYGEGYLVWGCDECGDIGDLERLSNP